MLLLCGQQYVKRSHLFRVCFFFILRGIECAKLPEEQRVVFPKLVESRSSNGVRVIQVTKDLTLKLEKSSVVGKEFLLRTYQEGFMQHTYLDGEALEEDLYHDAESLASVMVSEENGLRVEGILGLTLRIKPLDGQERTTEGYVPHVLYEYTDDDTIDDVKGVHTMDSKASVSQRQYDQQGEQLPEVVYPELLLLVDSALRAQFSADEKVLKYFIMTMNSVNLRYMTVSRPRVRLIFSALEILTSNQEGFLKKVGKDKLEGYDTLMELRMRVYRNYADYARYDVVYLVTGLDMGTQFSEGWSSGLKGIAFIGGACSVEKVGYGEDRVGTFMGVRILAHEVGHSLGCPHDGQGTGYFDSRKCPWNDGYIMSYLENDSRSMKFSNCCNDMITRKVSIPSGRCLLVQNTTSTIIEGNYTKFLPGDIYNRDRICKMAFPNVTDTKFVKEDNGTARCHARCSVPRPPAGEKTKLRVLLPDNSWCKEGGGFA
ncbi:venom metalloproteinase antarease TserMP_A-like isoform X2 [Amblyomma americanum]